MTLRARLLVTVGAVVVVSLVALALLSTRVTRVELERLEVEETGRALEAELDALTTAVAADRESAPAQVARWSGTFDALLLTADGAIVAASDPRLEAIRWTPLDGGLAGALDDARTVQLLVPSRPVPLGDDPAGARLYMIPPPPEAGRGAADARHASAVRLILLGLALLGGAALVVTATLARRLAEPLEELAEALATADLSRRLAVRGDDEIARVASAFNLMADRLERAERLRRELVSDVAHELRTPLTNLRAELEAVQDGLSAADEAQIASFHEEVLHLERLVSDLGELAAAEAGGLPLDLEAVDPREAAERSVRAVPHAAGRAEVRVEIPDGLPPVLADPRRLRQVLVNLLENALRHTPADGRVTVRGRAVEAGRRVELAVVDTGTGIPADRLEEIFERFVRLDPSRQRATGGAGLGLAIVRRWVEAQGGRVGVVSEEGRGARFWIRLPTATPGSPPRAHDPAGAPPQSGRQSLSGR